IEEDLGRREVQQSSAPGVVDRDAGRVRDRSRGPTCRECRICEAAEALGGGADACLAGPVSAKRRGLRAFHGVERGNDQSQFDSSHAQALKTRSVEEAESVQIPGIAGKSYRIASNSRRPSHPRGGLTGSETRFIRRKR